MLVGYGLQAHRKERHLLLLVLPLVLSLAFMPIADNDSPHGGFIRLMSALDQFRRRADYVVPLNAASAQSSCSLAMRDDRR